MGFETFVAFAGAIVVWSQFLGDIGFDLDDAHVWIPLREIIGPCVCPIRTRYVNLGENQDDFAVLESSKIGCQRRRVVKEGTARVQQDQKDLRNFCDSPSGWFLLLEHSWADVMGSMTDLQLSPDFEVTFKMCGRARHHSFILVARFTIGRGWIVIHPFIENLIGLIKPSLEQPLLVLLDLVLTHVVPPLRSLRTG